MRILYPFLFAMIVGITGCSTGNAKGVDNTSISYEPPQHSAPPSTKQTGSQANRVTTIRNLPITTAVDSSSSLKEIDGQSIVYIDPSQTYAINFFRSVWDKLTDKPTVIWIHSTPKIAENAWRAAGFNGNPLPSKETLFTDKSVPSPDTYRRNGKVWLELPGILPPEQSDVLGTFIGEKVQATSSH